MSRGKDYVRSIRGYASVYKPKLAENDRGQLRRMLRDLKAALFSRRITND